MAIVGQLTEPSSAMFVFIDESGDLLPKGLGSNHLVLSAFLTLSPSSNASTIVDLRYRLLSKGLNIESFHATDDSRLVRREFLEQFATFGDCLAISVGVKKEGTQTSQLLLEKYKQMLKTIAKEIVALNTDKLPIILLIDLTLDKYSRSEAKRELKYVFLSSKIDNFIYFQSMKRDFCGQIADYIAWSHFQKVERENDSYLLKIGENLKMRFLVLDDPPG
jgi:hypothetical protein